MKTFNDGEIYFIRETEYPSGKLSSFVKIGLVHYKEDRDSHGRLSEHQTGNPRRLILDKKHIVKTQAVDMVEARLHRIFSQSRISGEWFELANEGDLDNAVAEARRLAKEVAAHMPKFEMAMKLDTVKSNKKSRDASDHERELGEMLIVARKRSRTCEDYEKQIKSILTKAYNEGADITVAAKTTMRSFSPKFDVASFASENDKLFQSYLGEIETWKHTFDPIPRAKDLGSDFNEAIAGVQSTLDDVKRTGNFSDIVEATLTLANLKGIAEWEAKVAETELKIAIDRHDEINGVVRWKRYFDPTSKLDEARLAADHPAIYKKYIKTPEPKAFVNLKKTKS
jgi:hypothetical protein